MGYFPNGTAGMAYQERWCVHCKNYRDRNDGRGTGCPVWDIHLALGYHDGAEVRYALDILIPRSKDGLSNKECEVFQPLHPQAEAEAAGQIRLIE
jgi:hypothetical protein